MLYSGVKKGRKGNDGSTKERSAATIPVPRHYAHTVIVQKSAVNPGESK
jgi:hypothetical protein